MTLAQSLTADHHLLGDHRRARRLAAAAGDAVAHPRQLHRRRPEEGLRPGRRGRRHRRRRRPAPRRIRHHLPVVAGRLRARGRHHRGRALPDRPGPRRPLHRIPQDRPRRRGPLGPRHGRASCSGSSCGRRAASSSALLMAVGAVALGSLAWWLVRRKRAGRQTLIDPDLFRHPNFTAGISGVMLQNVCLGGAMIALPLFLQMTLEYNAMEAGPLAGPAVAHHVRRGAHRRASGQATVDPPASSAPDSSSRASGSRSSSRSSPASTAAGTSSSR